MRLTSTPNSSLNLEVSVLSIIECMLATTAYIFVGVRFGVLRFLAWSIVSAPLMLLRTDESADWGLALYAAWPLNLILWLSTVVSQRFGSCLP
jgi:hypothetical protein